MALLAGEWTEARGCFEHDLSTPETPEALDGLAGAARWLDDADTALRAREGPTACSRTAETSSLPPGPRSTWPIDEFEAFRRDVERNLLATLDMAGDLGERVRGGRRVERIRSTPDVPNR